MREKERKKEREREREGERVREKERNSIMQHVLHIMSLAVLWTFHIFFTCFIFDDFIDEEIALGILYKNKGSVLQTRH